MGKRLCPFGDNDQASKQQVINNNEDTKTRKIKSSEAGIALVSFLIKFYLTNLNYFQKELYSCSIMVPARKMNLPTMWD